MRAEHQEMQVKVDGYTRLCLTAIALLLTVLVIGLWADGVPVADRADAAEMFLNSSAQRKALIKAQEQTNAKLDELIKVLKGGEVKVKLVGGDASSKGAAKNASSQTQ